jgi:AraC family transcriptional regulator of adaptative response / DNA-3-methyladenine glycosylase II
VLSDELGAGPLAVARAQRAQTARLLLETTDVTVTEVAFASGFASLRQFNDTIRDVFATTPTALRQRRRTREVAEPGTVNLRLTYRQPCDVASMLSFLRQRVVPGVEAFEGDSFVRALDLPHGTGTVRLSEGPPGAGYVRASLALSQLRDLTVAVAHCRRHLDLDADPAAVDSVLGSGPLAGHVGARPGLRVPGTVDGAELAIRAVLGQQISVAGARTLAGRLSARYGRALPTPCGAGDTVTHTFARPDELAKADPADLPMPAGRARALIELCGAVAVGDLVLDGSAERGDVEHRLLAMRGIGPWTAGYIRMRALRDPDVWLGTDLEIVKALARLPGAAGPVDPAQWSPWRSYAVLHLWSGGPA